MARVTTRALPPSEISGSGSPVTGTSPTTPAMLSVAWPAIRRGHPGRDQAPERVGDPAGDPQPGVGQHARRGRARPGSRPTPSSSAMTAKMKSLCPLGSQPHFSRRLTQPDPEPAAVGDRVQALAAPGRPGRAGSRSGSVNACRRDEPVGVAGQEDQREHAEQADHEPSRRRPAAGPRPPTASPTNRMTRQQHGAEVVVADQQEQQRRPPGTAAGPGPARHRPARPCGPARRPPRRPAPAWPAPTAAPATGRGRATARRPAAGRAWGRCSTSTWASRASTSSSADQREGEDEAGLGQRPVRSAPAAAGTARTRPARSRPRQPCFSIEVNALPLLTNCSTLVAEKTMVRPMMSSRPALATQQVVRRERPGHQVAQQGQRPPARTRVAGGRLADRSRGRRRIAQRGRAPTSAPRRRRRVTPPTRPRTQRRARTRRPGAA